MPSRLINVRLDRERLDKVRRLRARGVTLSDLVRHSIDERYADLGTTTAGDIEAIVRGIFERYPDAPDLPPRGYDPHDRRAARAAILRQQRRRRGSR